MKFRSVGNDTYKAFLGRKLREFLTDSEHSQIALTGEPQPEFTDKLVAEKIYRMGMEYEHKVSGKEYLAAIKKEIDDFESKLSDLDNPALKGIIEGLWTAYRIIDQDINPV